MSFFCLKLASEWRAMLASSQEARFVMSPKTAEDYSILLVDDDPTVITVLGQVLQEYGRVRFACTGPEALRMVQQFPIDLVMLDIELPGMNGFEVCTAMKAAPQLSEIPVIFITGHDDVELEVKGLQLGAADFVTKPPRRAQVAARVAMQLRLHEMNKALRKAAATDPLTGVANRRHFDEALQREWLRAQRTGAPMSLLMIDVATDADQRALEAAAREHSHPLIRLPFAKRRRAVGADDSAVSSRSKHSRRWRCVPRSPRPSTRARASNSTSAR